MIINTAYDIGDIVYLITDIEQKARLVIGIEIRFNEHFYTLRCGVEQSYHYQQEFTKNKNYLT